jgi:hypothetical protein
VRLALDGSAPVITAAPTGASTVAVTSSVTAWQGVQTPSPLYSVPAGGGAVSSRTPTDFTGLAGSDANLYFDQAGASGYGVYSAPDATSAPTFLVGSQPAAMHAYQIAMAPGRVVWSDDTSAARPVWSRSLSTSGGVTVGGSTLVASHATALGLSASALRTAYTPAASGPGTVRIVGGPTTSTLTHVITLDPVQLSGTRAVYLASTGSGHVAYLMKNLVSGAVTNLTSTLGLPHIEADYGQVSLFGDYLTYAKTDGSIWRKDLSSSAKPVRLLSAAAHPPFASVYSFGDWVAWSRCSSSGCTGEFQNVRTHKSHALPKQASLAGASAAGVVTQVNGRYALQPWSGAAPHGLPVSHQFVRYGLSVYGSNWAAPAIDGSRMAWIGADGLPRVAPLGVKVADRPRSLGNPGAPHGLRHGSTWHFDLPTSADLTSCAVDIRTSAGKLVRALPCAAGAMKQGEVVASWDGTAHGSKVRDATYTWTVSAGNGSGTLLAGDGSTAATSGKVTVSG